MKMMDRDCRRSLGDVVVRRTSGKLSRRRTFARGEADAYKCLLSVSWTRRSGGPADPSTKPHSIRMRIGLHAASFSVDGVAPAVERQRWGSREKEGLTCEASREVREEVPTQLRGWLLFSRGDLTVTRWDFMEEVAKDLAQR